MVARDINHLHRAEMEEEFRAEWERIYQSWNANNVNEFAEYFKKEWNGSMAFHISGQYALVHLA